MLLSFSGFAWFSCSFLKNVDFHFSFYSFLLDKSDQIDQDY